MNSPAANAPTLSVHAPNHQHNTRSSIMSFPLPFRPRLRDARLRWTLALGALLSLNSSAFAGAFSLVEQNAASLGAAYSEAALADSAATVFFNPAGMTHLKGQTVSNSTSLIYLSGKFVNEDSGYTWGSPIEGNDGGSPGSPTPVPALFYTSALDARTTWGIGMYAPFGMATSWKKDWVGRYHGISSDLKTLNINPSIAYRLTDRLSIGAGVSLQWTQATLVNAVDFGLAGYSLGVPGFAPGSHDAIAKVRGDDLSWGGNVGLLWQATDRTRVGLAYRSQINNRLTGGARFREVPELFAPVFYNQKVAVDFDLPESFSLQLAHTLNDQWSVTADVTRTSWSVMEQIHIEFEDPNTPPNTIPQNWEDSVLVSAGVQYRRGRTIWKVGCAFDESPVKDANLRLPLVPDTDKVWVTFGYEHHLSDSFSMSGGYAHLFMKKGQTSFTDSQAHVLRGHFDLAVDILAFDAVWKF